MATTRGRERAKKRALQATADEIHMSELVTL